MTWKIRGNHPDFPHIAEAFRQMADRSTPDRAVGVIGGAIVENYLTEALIVSMHENEKLTKSLFGPSGALGNFGLKCDLAFLIGLVSKGAYRDLKTIVDIRNCFAHKLSVNDFLSDAPRDLARNLALVEVHTCESAVEHLSVEAPKPEAWQIGIVDRDATLADARGRFIIAVQVFVFGLSNVLKLRMPEPVF